MAPHPDVNLPSPGRTGSDKGPCFVCRHHVPSQAFFVPIAGLPRPRCALPPDCAHFSEESRGRLEPCNLSKRYH